MFARTPRLTLRPAWPEDADALAAALNDARIARMLMRVPFPYTTAEAEPFAARPRTSCEPRFLIMSHEAPVPVLVGGVALTDHGDGVELGYWLVPDAWGRGYATEACRATIAMARHALPIDRVQAWHFADNPASGAVLRKLGFRPTGRTMVKRSVARREPAPAVGYELVLDGRCEPARIAA